LVEIENEHTHGFEPRRIGLHHRGGRFEEAAAIEEAGQRIGRGRFLVAAHGAILGEDQDDEGGADDIKHDLDGEDRDPAGADAAHVERRQRHRQQKDRAVQHRHERCRPAPDE
jgi:hypothetical protein